MDVYDKNIDAELLYTRK